jgi:pyruvate dehydrogenase E1 component
MKILPDGIALWFPRPLVSLGTDDSGAATAARGFAISSKLYHRFITLGALSPCA